MADIKKQSLKPKKLRKASSPGALATELDNKLNAQQVQALIDATPAPSPDPSTSAEIFEDFMLTSQGLPGLYGWYESQGGTGSDSGVRIGPIESELNHPGCFMGQTGTTNTGFGGGNNGFDIPNFTFGNGVAYRLDMLVWIDALNDGVDDYQVAAGFSDTADPYGYNAAVS